MVAAMVLATLTLLIALAQQDPTPAPAPAAATPATPATAAALEILDLGNGCQLQGRVLRSTEQAILLDVGYDVLKVPTAAVLRRVPVKAAEARDGPAKAEITADRQQALVGRPRRQPQAECTPQAAGQDGRLWADVGKHPPAAGERKVGGRDAVDADSTARGPVEPGGEVQQGRLAGAAGADHGDALAGFGACVEAAPGLGKSDPLEAQRRRCIAELRRDAGRAPLQAGCGEQPLGLAACQLPGAVAVPYHPEFAQRLDHQRQRGQARRGGGCGQAVLQRGQQQRGGGGSGDGVR